MKNDEGDVYVDKDERWLSASGNEMSNPLLQLKRNASLLAPFLKNLNIQLPLNYYLIFVHPDFKKRMSCSSCDGFMITINRILYCKNCHAMQTIEEGMLFNIKELITVFPEKKITSAHDWCGK